MTHHHTITVVGGTGFVGRYVVKHLADAGYRIRVIARNPDAARALTTAGDPGQIVLVAGNITKPETLAGKLAGSYAVINLVGILFETGHQRFETLQTKGPETLAKMAREAGVKRFIQISALGVDKAIGSTYARTKLMGERAVLAAFPGATILRPSVVYGAEDNFFNQFAGMPVLPLIGGGNTRFQPVYVDDVAKAVAACLARPETAGNIYELGGVMTYRLRAIMELINSILHLRKPIIRIPLALASVMAIASETAFKLIPILRRPMLTRDQLRLLKYDNVVTPGAKGFADLGIIPQPVETILPTYLARFNPKKVI